MTDYKQDVKDSESKASGPECKAMVVWQPVQEIGPGRMKPLLRDWVAKVIFENLPDGLKKLGTSIKEGDVGIIKFAIELLHKLEGEQEDPQVVLESFAELLKKELDRLPAETGDSAGVEAPAGK